MEGTRLYRSSIQLTDSDTRVRSRTRFTDVLAFLRLGQGKTDSGDALFCRQETQMLRSHSSGNETDSLGLGKEVAANPERSCVRRFSSQPRTAPRASKQPGHIRTADTRSQNAIKQGTRPVSTPGSHTKGDPLRQRPLLGPIMALVCHGLGLYPHSFSDLPPQGSGAGRRAELGRPAHDRGRNHFLDPPGPRPALGRPGSPERDCGPGCQSRNRPELSTSRTRCSALYARLGSSLGIKGPGPGEMDSDVSLQQYSVIRWTRMGDPHVRAGEVVSRKLQVTVFCWKADSSSGRPEQFVAPL